MENHPMSIESMGNRITVTFRLSEQSRAYCNALLEALAEAKTVPVLRQKANDMESTEAIRQNLRDMEYFRLVNLQHEGEDDAYEEWRNSN
jgi:hypothetical protein